MSEPAGRPERLVVVAGTSTEVGKTWATCAIAAAARERGIRVAARKPVQSFEADASGAPLQPTDADLLAVATGEEPHAVCPEHRWYPLAMAPPMAADALGRAPLALDDIVGELRWEPGTHLGFVETIGGVRSPLTHDADSGGLANALAPELTILVADAALGTINATHLSIEALRPLEVVVLLNRFDPADELHARNLGWLVERLGYRVVVDALDVPVAD